MPAHRYPYCSRSLREKGTVKCRHRFEEGKEGERKMKKWGRGDDCFRFIIFGF